MPEHLIHLRRAWTEHLDGGLVQRLDLPLGSPPDRSLSLSRRFGRPPREPASDSLLLRITQAPGLLNLRLNGCVLLEGPLDDRPLDIPLPPDLPARNLLELDVDAEAAGRTRDWGQIALVVRS